MPSTQTDQIDGLSTSVAVKAPVRVATTANIALAGLLTIDGVTLVEGDRVLVKNQTSPIANGIYDASASSWARSPDFDGTRDVVDGTQVYVRQGSTNGATYWQAVCADFPVNIGTSSVTFNMALFGSSSTLSFLQAGTGAVLRGLQTKVREFAPTPQDFGAVGDGVADDTTPLQNWLTALGTGYWEIAIVGPGVGFLPAGKYKYSAAAGLTIPFHVKIYGVPFKSVLQPTSAITLAAVIQQAGSTLEGVVIDGVNVGAGKIGLSIGASGLTNDGITRDVVVTKFVGSGSMGLRYATGVHWLFDNCRFDDNEDGAKLLDSLLATPTATLFNYCSFKSNDRRGLWIQSCTNILFNACLFELNGTEGAYINNAGTDTPQSITFIAPYVEANQQDLASGAARHAAYEFFIRAAAVTIRDGYFQDDLNGARAMLFEAAADFVIDHCDVRSESGQIAITSGSSGVISNWIESAGEIFTTITDSTTYGSVKYLYEKRGTWTPEITFSTPGNLSVAYAANGQQGRYIRRAREYKCSAVLETSTFTHTTASGTFRVTGLPATAKAVTGWMWVGACSWSGVTKANFTNLIAKVPTGANYVEFEISGSAQAVAALAFGDMPTGGAVKMRFEVEFEV